MAGRASLAYPATGVSTIRPQYICGSIRWLWPVRSEDGRIKRGDLVLTEALGGGLTWGAALLRW